MYRVCLLWKHWKSLYVYKRLWLANGNRRILSDEVHPFMSCIHADALSLFSHKFWNIPLWLQKHSSVFRDFPFPHKSAVLNKTVHIWDMPWNGHRPQKSKISKYMRIVKRSAQSMVCSACSKFLEVFEVRSPSIFVVICCSNVAVIIIT